VTNGIQFRLLHFPHDPRLADSPQFYSSTCSGRVHMGITGTGFNKPDAFP